MLRSPLIMEDSFAEKFSTAAPPTISTIGVFPKVPSTKLFLPAPMNEEEANFIVLVAPAPKNDWLEEEIKHLEHCKAWLQKEVGAKRNFDWGSIWCGYDSLGGFSSIKINYSRQ